MPEEHYAGMQATEKLKARESASAEPSAADAAIYTMGSMGGARDFAQAQRRFGCGHDIYDATRIIQLRPAATLDAHEGRAHGQPLLAATPPSARHRRRKNESD